MKQLPTKATKNDQRNSRIEFDCIFDAFDYISNVKLSLNLPANIEADINTPSKSDSKADGVNVLNDRIDAKNGHDTIKRGLAEQSKSFQQEKAKELDNTLENTLYIPAETKINTPPKSNLKANGVNVLNDRNDAKSRNYTVKRGFTKQSKSFHPEKPKELDKIIEKTLNIPAENETDNNHPTKPNSKAKVINILNAKIDGESKNDTTKRGLKEQSSFQPEKTKELDKILEKTLNISADGKSKKNKQSTKSTQKVVLKNENIEETNRSGEINEKVEEIKKRVEQNEKIASIRKAIQQSDEVKEIKKCAQQNEKLGKTRKNIQQNEKVAKIRKVVQRNEKAEKIRKLLPQNGKIEEFKTMDIFPCNDCEASFKQKYHLEEHINAAHSKIKPYTVN